MLELCRTSVIHLFAIRLQIGKYQGKARFDFEAQLTSRGFLQAGFKFAWVSDVKRARCENQKSKIELRKPLPRKSQKQNRFLKP